MYLDEFTEYVNKKLVLQTFPFRLMYNPYS